mmetsp:Transcript_68870/g.213011  ORF Transcript_68870/g.213011 Transcript_68870/m.213011 type:complete len:487 (+) Transcript_68870:43-1503(+)
MRIRREGEAARVGRKRLHKEGLPARSRSLPSEGLPLGRLAQPVVDVLRDHLRGWEVEDQGRRQRHAGELLGERVLELNRGQAVKTGVHERSVAGEGLGANQAQRHVHDGGGQHLLAGALVLLLTGVDQLEQLVDQRLARGVTELLEDSQGLVAGVLRGVVLVVHEVHLRHQRPVVRLAHLVAALDADGDALVDVRPRLVDLVGHDVHLGNEGQGLGDELVVLGLLGQGQGLLGQLQRPVPGGAALGALLGGALLDAGEEGGLRDQEPHVHLILREAGLLVKGLGLPRGSDGLCEVLRHHVHLGEQEGGIRLPLLALLRVEELHGVRGRVDGLHHVEPRAMGAREGDGGDGLPGPVPAVPADVAGVRSLLEGVSVLLHGEAAVALRDEEQSHVLLHADLLEDGQPGLRRLVALPVLLVGQVDVGDAVEHARLPSLVVGRPVLDVAHEREAVVGHAQGLRMVVLRKVHCNQRVPAGGLALLVPPLLEA